MKILKGQTALLSGASRGLGVYMARSLAKKGMNLTLAARSAQGLEGVRKEIEGMGVRAIAVPTDVAERGALERLVERVRELGQGCQRVFVAGSGGVDSSVVTTLLCRAFGPENTIVLFRDIRSDPKHYRDVQADPGKGGGLPSRGKAGASGKAEAESDHGKGPGQDFSEHTSFCKDDGP